MAKVLNSRSYGRRSAVFHAEDVQWSFDGLDAGHDVEAEVEGANAVGEGSDGDDVDAGGGDVVDAVEVDAAAGFDEDAAIDLSDGGAEVGNGEVVEQDAVDAGGEDGLDLVEAIDLDFDVGGVGEGGAGFDERVGEGGGGGAARMARWLSLAMRASEREKRWLWPPPQRTA